MHWAVLVGILLIICIFIIYAVFIFNFIKLRTRPLSLSDHLGISGVLANAMTLVIAIVSLAIAYYSYDSSRQGGDEQLRALKAAREAIIVTGREQKQSLEQSQRALDSVVETSKVQQKLLSKSLRASEAQLAIIQEQRARELERPDIYAEIFDPSHLKVKFYNKPKNKVASYITFDSHAISLDQVRGEYLRSYTARPITVNPSGDGSHLIPLDFGPEYPGSGNRLFGYLSVECPECEVQKRIYWYGCQVDQKTCWYHEGTLNDYPGPITQYRPNPPSMKAYEIFEKFQTNPNRHRIINY